MCGKPIVLIVGESGSGKSTICQYLSDYYGLKELKSYTTRPQRGEFDTSHTFITQEEFNCICVDAVAYTKFDDFEYCATKVQVDKSDLYVVDINGVKTFMNIYDGERIPYVVYVRVDGLERLENMIRRGDSLYNAVRRIQHDKEAFKDVYDYASLTYENHIDDFKSVKNIGDSIYKEFFEGEE